MKKIISVFLAVIILSSLFTACNGNNEETLSPEDELYSLYTAEIMTSEIAESEGVDVSDIVASRNVEKMTASEKREFMIYLRNYAHYKELTVERFAADFTLLSPETLSEMKSELEKAGFEIVSVDDKISLGQKFSEEYTFYDSGEEDAVHFIILVLGGEEKTAESILENKGYFKTEDKKERSRILYGILFYDED